MILVRRTLSGIAPQVTCSLVEGGELGADRPQPTALPEDRVRIGWRRLGEPLLDPVE